MQRKCELNNLLPSRTLWMKVTNCAQGRLRATWEEPNVSYSRGLELTNSSEADHPDRIFANFLQSFYANAGTLF
jgi:hypothetical protein